MSSFIVTKDCSLLRFFLFCSHAGIIKSAPQILRLYFENIFVVIKPGHRHLQNGAIQVMFELPKIDVEKINKYLDFKNQKKA